MCTSVLQRLTAVSVLCLAGGMCGAAQAEDWQYSVQPYLWLPTINTTFRFSAPAGGSAPESEVGPNDWLSNLQMLVMLNGEARKGDWSIISDVVYLSFAGEKSHVKSIDFNADGAHNRYSSSLDAGSNTTFKGLEWTLAGSKVVARNRADTFEVLGGVRYFGLKATADWALNASVSGPAGTSSFPANGSISERVDLWNAIAGVRGDIQLGAGNWHVPYYLDFGVGPDAQSWQAMLGLGYRFKWGSANFAYRHIAYDQPSDKLVQNLSFSGPAFGASFKF
ncbi:hypothetical protein [Uliginosibacterium sp. TH139]|uniref:hypothetical protein n=1 Tax=Uliginosibacterium sp. TH139 TaxID=2067453 RepID=UPI0011800A50|nr:hypothetical protein [Uliginosibacterium sp. TH139]